MLLKIGELARRTGLTVRALRHYNDIALLVPSARSTAGYRLYGRQDVARLYRIQALQRLDLSLAEIQGLLDNAAGAISQVVAQQVAQLDRDIEVECMEAWRDEAGGRLSVKPVRWRSLLRLVQRGGCAESSR